MNYSLENVKKLIKITGFSAKKCAEALKLNSGSIENSKKWLEYKSNSNEDFSFLNKDKKNINCGIIKMEKDDEKAFSFVLKCESDFTEKTSIFLNLLNDLSKLFFEKFEEISNSKTPEILFKSFSQNKVNEISFFVKENVFIENFKFFTKKNQETFGLYIHHNKKLASLVICEKCDEGFAREIAINVAINEPIFKSKEDIPNNILVSKISEIKNSLSDEIKKKSDSVVSRIIDGKLNKWYSEVCFFEQKHFRNPEISVGEFVFSKKISIREIFFTKI